MANDSVDGNKVSKELSAAHDKDSLHAAFQDMKLLHDKDGGTQGAFKQDLAQIDANVDLKKLGLDGFHLSGFAEADSKQFLRVVKPGVNAGDKPVTKVVDQDGNFYDTIGNKLKLSGDRAFASTDAAPAPAPAPAKVADAGTDAAPPPAPAKVADTGTDAAPPPAPAAAADNSFGAHGRTFDVNADGKAVYTAKHGDTYWSVAADLLTKPDHKPTNTEIQAQVNALATLNNKSDANKLKIGEPIILPITPAAPTDGKTAPTDGKTAPTDGKTAPTDGKTAPTDGKTAPTDGKTAPTDGKTAPTDGKTDAAPALPAPAPTGPVGFDMKAHADALKPQNDVYSPLSPLGMSGAGPDADKATLAGDASKPVVEGTKTTQETDLNLKDGSAWLFGYGRTGVKNTDVTEHDILKSRETTYDIGVSMKIAGPKGPVALDGVTHIVTKMNDNGNYTTDVTAANGVHHFTTDSSGKVQRSVDQNGKVALLEAPSESTLASLNLDAPAPTVAPKVIADTGAPAKVDASIVSPPSDAVNPP